MCFTVSSSSLSALSGRCVNCENPTLPEDFYCEKPLGNETEFCSFDQHKHDIVTAAATKKAATH